jgi:acyl-CoA synthetase (NDP forming)
MLLLKKYGVAVPRYEIFKEFSHTKLSYPLALKIDTKEAVHKTEKGLVRLNLKTKEEIRNSIKDMRKNLRNIKTYNFMLQEMVSGTELIIGMKRDDAFGPVLIYGLGGIFTEVLKDVSMRIAPITKGDAASMMEEIKGKRLLEGYRGATPANRTAIVDLLLKLSRLSMNEKKIKEIDFNPVIADSEKAIVVDARIIEC